MKKIPLYKQGIEFEPLAYREENRTHKALLTYDKSLERLRAAGYERHPQPAEVFSLLADNLEGKLDAQEKAIADDMLKNYGEWLSVAVERKGNVLVAYFDPVGLQWNERANKYGVKGTLLYSHRNEYDVTGKPSEQWIDLEQFSPEFVQDMYSRPFAKLPEKMQEGNQRVQVWLSSDGEMWPVGRGGQFDFDNIFVRASRGVRTPVSPSETHSGVLKTSNRN